MSTTKFQAGQVVTDGVIAVLVTSGAGKADYPSFSGVIVMAIPDDEGTVTWPVGRQSDTWRTAAFALSGIDLSEIVRKAIGR